MLIEITLTLKREQDLSLIEDILAFKLYMEDFVTAERYLIYDFGNMVQYTLNTKTND